MMQAVETKLADDREVRRKLVVEQCVRRMLARSSLNTRVVAFRGWVNFVVDAKRLRNASEKAARWMNERVAAAAFIPWLRAARDPRPQQVRDAVVTLEAQTAGFKKSLNAMQDELVEQRAVLATQQEDMRELVAETVTSHAEKLCTSFAAEVSEKTEAVRVSFDAQLSANA